MKERKRIVHLLIGPLLFGLFTALLPHGVFTTFESRAAIGTIMWMAYWWLTGPVDYASMELLHAKLVRTTTCVDGCRCDYTICGDKDPYLKGHPEYRDEAGFRRNR